MTCPNCGGENLTDYPVCMACAPKCHAIGRIEIGLNCIHCDIQKDMLVLIEQVADLQNPRFNNVAYMEFTEEIDRLADIAQDVLAKMKGGNNA
jgi:hypothetical protein